jgi:hypothetical protein
MPDGGDPVTGWRCGISLRLGEARASGEVQRPMLEWSGVAAGPGRGAGPRCLDFWWPGETGAVARWLAGRREASGLPGAAEVGLILGALRGRKFRQGPDARPAD